VRDHSKMLAIEEESPAAHLGAMTLLTGQVRFEWQHRRGSRAPEVLERLRSGSYISLLGVFHCSDRDAVACCHHLLDCIAESVAKQNVALLNARGLFRWHGDQNIDETSETAT